MTHLLQFMFALMITHLCYQPVQAAANYFTARPVRSGDTLISILRQLGFSNKERNFIVSSHAQLQNLFLTLDTNYLIHKRQGFTELRIYDSQASNAFKIVKKNDLVTVTPYHPQFKITLLRVRGKIQGSILGSVLAKVNSNFVASRFNDAYAFDIKSRRSIRNGADYWFTVQKKYDQDQFIKFGEILETSLEFEGRSLRKKFVRNQNGGVFLNAESIRNKKPLYAPVNYLKIASLFQPNRLHPITGRRQAHLGVDFELPIGEPVLAARQGFVKRYGYHRAAGNFIVILHSHGIETAYNHLSKIDKKIYQGRKILAGDKIGEIGCTGYCTRAHLHFAVKQNGQMVNPMKYLMPYPFKMENRLSTRIAEL